MIPPLLPPPKPRYDYTIHFPQETCLECETLDRRGWGCDAVRHDYRPDVKSIVSVYRCGNGHEFVCWHGWHYHGRPTLTEAIAEWRDDVEQFKREMARQ